MAFRVLPFCLALAAFAMFTVPAIAEDKDNAHEGTVVKAGEGKLTMTGKDGKEHTHTVGAKAKISLDGKKCTLDDLKAGTKIKVTTKKGDETTALRIEGKSK